MYFQIELLPGTIINIEAETLEELHAKIKAELIMILFSPKEKNIKKFNDELENYLHDIALGKDVHGRGIFINECPYILEGLNESMKIVYTTGAIIDKILLSELETKHGHNIPRELLNLLPVAIFDPIAICCSMTNSTGNSIIFITDLIYQGKKLMCAMKLDASVNRLQVHYIASMYGKNDSVYCDMLESSVLYYDEKRIFKIIPNSQASITLRGKHLKNSKYNILKKDDFVNSEFEKILKKNDFELKISQKKAEINSEMSI